MNSLDVVLTMFLFGFLAAVPGSFIDYIFNVKVSMWFFSVGFIATYILILPGVKQQERGK